jgi:hypothetical protein
VLQARPCRREYQRWEQNTERTGAPPSSRSCPCHRAAIWLPHDLGRDLGRRHRHRDGGETVGRKRRGDTRVDHGSEANRGERRCRCRLANCSLLYPCSASPTSPPLYFNEHSSGHTGGFQPSPACARLTTTGNSTRQKEWRGSGVRIALALFHAVVSCVSEVVVHGPYHTGVQHLELEVRV